MLSGHRKRSRKFLLYEKSVTTSIRISSLTEIEQQKHCVQGVISSRNGQKSKILEGQVSSPLSQISELHTQYVSQRQTYSVKSMRRIREQPQISSVFQYMVNTEVSL